MVTYILSLTEQAAEIPGWHPALRCPRTEATAGNTEKGLYRAIKTKQKKSHKIVPE